MITLGMMQFAAVVLMVLLTLKLLLLRSLRPLSKVTKQARRLMACGTALLALHFALQLKYGLRLMGITQSVILNLAMFIPASYIFSRAILLLQRRGQLTIADRWIGPVVWVVVMTMMAAAAAIDGQSLFSDTPELRQAEIAGAVLYMLMQGHYTGRHIFCLLAMRRALHDYYDRDTEGMLLWMQLSIVGIILLALMVPIAIFCSGSLLFVIALILYIFIFYLVDSFCFFLISPAPERLQAAEQYADEMEEEKKKTLKDNERKESKTDVILSDEVMLEMEKAVEAWKNRGGYRKNGLLQPQAAADIGVTRYRLTCWLHQRGLKYTEWIATLRVNEAKRVIMAHPGWSSDAIAQHCGFADRSVLQRTFKKIEGITPQKYAEQGGIR